MRCSLTHVLVCLALILGMGRAASAVDGTDMVADSVLTTAADDTVGVLPDPAWAWRQWPPIGAAIAIAPLDGPQDILEKEEIVQDRIDALGAEFARLDTIASAWLARHVAMTAQLEVLEDLADLQFGGDLEVQQRLESVREDVQQAAREIERHTKVLQALQRESDRLRALAATYRQQAAQLRAEEESLR